MTSLLYDEVGKAFVFKKLRPGLRIHFSKAGYNEVPYSFFGMIFWITVVTTAILYVLKVYPWLLTKQFNPIEFFFAVFLSWIVIHGALVILSILALYSYLDIKIFNRVSAMESKLQDYLQFVSENLKGGMSFERALWSAVRPQFGVLAEEMSLCAKKVMTGQDAEEAINDFTQKYNSPLLKRSFDLIVEGTKGGGEVAETIDRVVENLEEIKELKGEIRATNLTYLIFVGVIVVVVAPLLFSLSYQFLTILNSFADKLDTDPGASGINAPFAFSKTSINLQEFRNFSQAALTVISIFSSMIISIISQGNVRGGIKYIPFFLGSSLFFYFLFSFTMQSLFGSILV